MLDINVLGMNNNLKPDETVNTVINSNVTNKINFRCKRIMQYVLHGTKPCTTAQ